MRLTLLGTASGDGWPNPFCTCASCAGMRSRGEVRGQTSVLVDDVLLLDCGPQVPGAAAQRGRSLAGVRHLLITHAHHDHLGPAALVWRSWAGRPEPLDLVGPPAVLEACADWIGPDDPVVQRAVYPGDRLRLAGYDVRVLAARHDEPWVGPAVLYDVTGPEGGRVLYATDTGPMPTPTLEAVSGAAYDVVLLEETFGDATDHGTDHLNLPLFAETLAQLRRRGAVTDRTRVVPVHLSHRNPPTVELARRLAAWGAELLPDGADVEVGEPAPRRPAAPHRVLLIGGARSGKSAEAERRLAAEPSVTYVATATHRPEDPEWVARLAAHRARRPASWRTLETTDVAGCLRDERGPLLVDCLSMWLAAQLEEPELADRLDGLVVAWRQTAAYVVAVSNEVGSGVVPAYESGRRFRDELGRLNARLAAESDEVWLLTAGMVTRLR